MTNLKTGGKYKFATIKENYEDFSSGRVLYGAPGATGFPVRLTSEIFQRAEAKLESERVKPPYSVYDPFCGTGYSLTLIGLLHGNAIKSIFASDIEKEALVTAQKNLSLLTTKGLNNRILELNHLKDSYNKISHKEALESAMRLKNRVPNTDIKIFEFNILSEQDLPIPKSSIDLVLTDLPYGKLTQWRGDEAKINSTQDFLNNISPILKPNAVIAISANKKQKLAHEGYKRIDLLKLGKRQVLFLVKQ